ncbi:MAG: hypothetical protein FJ225_07900 [Lentisphaerae bacterium]|nr:hypothetical protein [Lentisphaerota bacterium]
MKRRPLSEVAPQLRAEWDSEKNTGLEFDRIHASSSTRVAWVCKTVLTQTMSVRRRLFGERR